MFARYLTSARGLALTLFLARAACPQIAAVLDPAGSIWQTGRVTNGQVCGVFVVPPQVPENVYCGNATVTKLDPTGTQTLFTTTFGGHGDSGGLAIATDPAGNIYVAGYTTAPNFPVTAGALQRRNAGPNSSEVAGPAPDPGGDVFVVKLNPSGAVVYATLLGGSGDEVPIAITADGTGAVYVAGSTSSTNFPLTPSPLYSLPGGWFVVKISPGGGSLDFSTYFPATLAGLAVDSNDAVYVTGNSGAGLPTTGGAFQTTFGGGDSDAFVTKIAPSGNQLTYSTYLGGPETDWANAVAVDSQGAAWIGGETFSPAFPGTTGSGGGFLVKLSPDGGAIETGRLFGPPNSYSGPSFVAVDAQDDVYASGEIDLGINPSAPPNFQTTSNAQLSIPCQIYGGTFLIEEASSGSMLYASYMRRLGTIFVTAPGHLLIETAAGALPVDLTSTPPMNFQCPVNAASYTVPTAPGEIVSVFGYGLGPDTGVVGQPDASGRFPTSLAGVQVEFNGVPAPLLYVQAGQINTVVPVANLPNFLYTVQISYQNQNAPLLDVWGEIVNPGVFAVANEDWTLNSPAHPAQPGSIISIYATGMDLFGIDFPDGELTPVTALLPINFSQSGDMVTFGGVPGTILWEGAAPGLILGVEQINVQLPELPSPPSVTMVVESAYVYSSPPFTVYIGP